MRTIQLTKGYEALVDDEDYPRLNQYKWCVSKEPGYAIRREGVRPGYLVYMHKEVLNTTEQVDHRDQNTLNNQRYNLRLASTANNSMNRSLQSNNTSGFKGVSFCQGKWQAYIKLNGKKINLGTFETKEAAAHAYDSKARELFGEFAVTNDAPIINKETFLASI